MYVVYNISDKAWRAFKRIYIYSLYILLGSTFRHSSFKSHGLCNLKYFYIFEDVLSQRKKIKNFLEN